MPGTTRGRPRSSAAHHAILRAARDLLVAGGYEKLTIDAIAAQAGVGRQTVYRRWSTKSGIVAEAVLAEYLEVEFARPPDTGDLAADLRAWLRDLLAPLSDPTVRALARGLAAAAAESAAHASRLYEQVSIPLRRLALERLAVAVQQGQVRADADAEAAVDALIGTLLYRVFVHEAVPSSDAGDGFVELLMHGVAAPRFSIQTDS